MGDLWTDHRSNDDKPMNNILATDILAFDILATDILAFDILAADISATDIWPPIVWPILVIHIYNTPDCKCTHTALHISHDTQVSQNVMLYAMRSVCAASHDGRRHSRASLAYIIVHNDVYDI